MVFVKRTLRGKRVLVTGGAGFIGSHLVDHLIAEGVAELIVVDNFFLGQRANLAEAYRKLPGLQLLELDAAGDDVLRAAFSRLGTIDVVFDLAVIPLPNSLEDPQFCFDTNVRITSHLCELLRKGYFGTLVHFSSSEAYGTAMTVPMSEEHPLKPITPYAASKAAGDHLVRTYVASFNVDALIVRPFNNYGPRQNDQLYAGIIPMLLSGAFGGNTFKLFGDGRQTRDYIYVTDTVRAVLALYACFQERGQVVNIASGQEISMIDLKTKIEHILGHPIPMQQCDPRPGDVQRLVADTTRLKSLTGFAPQVSFDDGLVKTIEFYRQRASTMQGR
ncbi:dTDP-glucose 4,6-dehydratase [Dictyobacter arantiisoli]|uniref:Epimerase n=1 Tax=Dictyobacter arantiisoli TaxID=2014874 RepID=A0A5A5TET7_9CHLR|nr:NAD-dependent epimerase/dehydratase family protein [Dictyobacter arantiisoli]GCF10081.1 epimerase [Dictyobacter arantiisoli]